MAEILLIRRKTLSNQLINQSIDLQRIMPPMLRTPVDARPDIERYLNDASRMRGRYPRYLCPIARLAAIPQKKLYIVYLIGEKE